MSEYDVCIIGMGPSGFACAMKCVDYGNKVCIIEGKHVGGAGVMNGAMTSKAMWEISRRYSESLSEDSVYRVSSIHMQYSDLKNHVIEMAKKKQYQLLSQLYTYSSSSDETAGSVEYIRGMASFLDRKSVEVVGDKGEKSIVYAKKFVIATGSHPRELPGVKYDGKQILSSDDILNMEDFPKRIMVIGAGIIGCEFSTIFANFKHTKVHLLDRSFRVIPFEDDDVSQFVHKNLEDIGVEIHSESSLKEIKQFDDYIQVILTHRDGRAEIIEVDAVLVTIGRGTNTETLNLKNAGIEYEPNKILKVDDDCCLKDNIYVVGDMSGNAALYNVAEMEGRYCADAMNTEKMSYKLRYGHLMPTIMFFHPEVASVGYNEKQCRELKIPYKVAYFSSDILNRAIAMGGTNGFVKVITTYDDDPYILGMRTAGPQASSNVMFAAPLIDSQMPVSQVLKAVHPHPSMTEGIQSALRAIKGESIMKPKAFPDKIKINYWCGDEQQG